jgi:hypothetical protein
MTNLFSNQPQCSRRWRNLCNKFVISTGQVIGLRPTQGDENLLPSGDHSPWKRHAPLCHLSIPITNPQWKRRPPLVIPSAAEGPAVLRTFRGNVVRQKAKNLSSRPERSGVERSAVFSSSAANSINLARIPKSEPGDDRRAPRQNRGGPRVVSGSSGADGE